MAFRQIHNVGNYYFTYFISDKTELSKVIINNYSMTISKLNLNN